MKDPEDNWVIPLVLLEYLPDEVFQWVVREVGETEVTVRDIIKRIQLYVVNLEGGKRISNPQDPHHLIGRGTMQRPSKGSVGSYAVTQKVKTRMSVFLFWQWSQASQLLEGG